MAFAIEETKQRRYMGFACHDSVRVTFDVHSAIYSRDLEVRSYGKAIISNPQLDMSLAGLDGRAHPFGPVRDDGGEPRVR